VFREAHLAGADAEGLRHLIDRPKFHGMQIKHLIMPRVGLTFHARQCGRKQSVLPLLLPYCVEIKRRISNALERRCTRCLRLARAGRPNLPLTFTELICDAPANDGQQPAFE
jgi:hypothetical protein